MGLTVEEAKRVSADTAREVLHALVQNVAREEELVALRDVLEEVLSSRFDVQPDVKTSIAREAVRIVNGARRGAYGVPENNFARIARFWTAYMRNTDRDVEITAADVSPLMRLMKEARLCETPDHRDSHVDMVGYTLAGAEVVGVTP